MARSISKCKCLNSGTFEDSGCSLQNSVKFYLKKVKFYLKKVDRKTFVGKKFH